MSAEPPTPSTYRPDIDGLRAIAVVAVILCHVGAYGTAGGFLGVDVFFVISGYLIHRDLIARLDAGRLSVLAFYGRRLRRTLPALYVAAALTGMAAAFVLLPGDLEAFARSLGGVLLGVPNLFFLAQVGYFDPDAVTKPLLHTWSLGVEEQFYLVAPLLALSLRPLAPRARAAAILVAFGLALAFALQLQAVAPAATFYLMPARLFEFLIGAVLAEPWLAEPWLPPARSRVFAEAATGLALVALIASFVAFDAALPHPGWRTLLPCLAAATIIHVGATRRTMVGAVFASRPAVAIGRISYSLYLYHWPILVLARYAELPTSLPWRLGEGLLLVALSVASYRFVEQPFRRPGPWRQRASALLPAGAAMLAACCAATLLLGGFPGRFAPQVDRLAAYARYGETQPYREGRCFVTSKEDAAHFDRGTCLQLSADKPNVLLLGDSHAAHLWTGLRDAWPGINFLQATASGCKPVLDTVGAPRCTALIGEMFARFIPAHRLAAVVLSALWDEADVEPLRRTLAALRGEGQHAVVFGPLPRYDVPMAALLARAVLHGDLGEAERHRLAATAILDARMRSAVSPLATYISTWDAMCPNRRCRLFAAPGVPMQFDYHHLTAAGAEALMQTIAARHPDLFDATAEHGRLDISNE